MTTETTSWLLDRWLARLSESLEGMAGERPELAPEVSVHEPTVSLVWRQTLSLGPGADVLVRAEESVWHGVGSRVLALAGIENAAPDELRSTFTEILAQSVSLLASEIGTKLGQEITSLESSIEAAAPPGVEWQGVSLVLAGEKHLGLGVAWGDRLIQALQPKSPVAAPSVLTPAAQLESKPRTMDLLLEVDLPVSVSFGRSQMRLKDVVKLTTGSIVELNRSISEPVEIIVNNCVIARGEVVVVEGNYGVRIKQIVSRQERLRSLF